MILLIDLKIVGEHERNISIEKHNKLKIINSKTYLNFYKYFYLKKDILIQNKELSKKDYIIIDITSFVGIIRQMEFSKGSIFYEYVTDIYENFSLEDKEKFYREFLNQVDMLREKINIDFEIIAEDNIDKVIMQNLDIEINFDILLEKFIEVLNKVMIENVNKTYIIFYDSKIIDIKLDGNNYYLFDVNQFLDISSYNLLISNEVIEFSLDSLIDYVESIWPVDYTDGEIKSLLIHYFKYLIYLDYFDTVSVEIYLIGIILNKIYGLSQKINYTKEINNNIIKSFIDTF